MPGAMTDTDKHTTYSPTFTFPGNGDNPRLQRAPVPIYY